MPPTGSNTATAADRCVNCGATFGPAYQDTCPACGFKGSRVLAEHDAQRARDGFLPDRRGWTAEQLRGEVGHWTDVLRMGLLPGARPRRHEGDVWLLACNEHGVHEPYFTTYCWAMQTWRNPSMTDLGYHRQRHRKPHWHKPWLCGICKRLEGRRTA